VYESCDGAKLSIGNVYYIEFMFYTDNSKDVYVNPLDLELLIAKKHGILSKIKVIFLWIINTYLKKKLKGLILKSDFGSNLILWLILIKDLFVLWYLIMDNKLNFFIPSKISTPE